MNPIPDNVVRTGAPQAWAKGYDGRGIVVAVIDSGCDMNHPELKGKVIGLRNLFPSENPDDVTDHTGHGTHVAGTVVSMAPGAKLLILKALDSNGASGITTIRAALRYAIDWRGPKGERVRIINVATGGPTPGFGHIQHITEANAKGIAVVAAAGNNGDGKAETVELWYPAAYKECICVGAADPDNKVAIFSNSNDAIDLVAPGVNVYSSVPGGKYDVMHGTSMATPHVSGALAILTQVKQAELGREITEPEMYAELMKHVKKIDGVPAPMQGAGLLSLNVVPTTYISTSEVTLEEAVQGMVDAGVIMSPEYWLAYARVGKTVKGDNIDALVRKLYIVYTLGAKVKV